MKRINFGLGALVLVMGFVGSHLTQASTTAPSVFLESQIVPPSDPGTALPRTLDVTVTINESAQGFFNSGKPLFTLNFQALAPGSPSIPSPKATPITMETTGGTQSRAHLSLTLPPGLPDGALYQMDLVVYSGLPGIKGSPLLNNTLATQSGYLLVRRKPSFEGDLDDNGKTQVTDVVFTLRLATGLEEPTPYLIAVGDTDHDGQVTMRDATRLLQWLVEAPGSSLPYTPLFTRTLAQGIDSGVALPGRRVITTQEEWNALWKLHTSNQPAATQPPPVDFNSESVIAVFLGSRPTLGYGIEVVNPRATSRDWVVDVAKTAPTADAPRITTSPYAFIAVPRLDTPVRFLE